MLRSSFYFRTLPLCFFLAAGCSHEDGNPSGDGSDLSSGESDSSSEADAFEPDGNDDTDGFFQDDTEFDSEDGLNADGFDSDGLDEGDVPDLEEPEPEFPRVPPALGFDLSLCSTGEGSLNVFDIQNPSCERHPRPEPIGLDGPEVELEGLIVTGVFGDTWTAQDPVGGPYSGIIIFNHGLHSSLLEVGDIIRVTGTYSEYFGASQVYLDTVKVLGHGEEPEPYFIANPGWVSTNGPWAEIFEGVLLEVPAVSVTNINPDCPYDYGEFQVSEGLRIDDMGYKWKTDDSCTGRCARIGDSFTGITGPLMYSFGNSKLEPRKAADIPVLAKGQGAVVTKCIASECIAPVDAPVTRDVLINEVMPDPMGSDTYKEWIELYNPGNTALSLDGYILRDCSTQEVFLMDEDLVIPANGYILLAASNSPSRNPDIYPDYAYGVETFFLPNTVGAILLYNSQNVLVDQVRYSRFQEWTGILETGASIERKGPQSDGTKASSWAKAKKYYGEEQNKGTPRAKNSAY